MNEFLFGTPGYVLRGLLDFKSSAGAKFSDTDVIADLMIDLNEDTLRKPRDYAKRWNWNSHVTAWRRIKTFMLAAAPWIEKPSVSNSSALWVSFCSEPVKQRETTVKQLETKIGDSGQLELIVKQDETARNKGETTTPYISRARETKTKTKTKSKGLSVDKHVIREPGAVIESVDYELVRSSWNNFAKENGLPLCRQINDKRKKHIRTKYGRVWPEIKEIYAAILKSPHCMGKNGWLVNFDFIWNTRDGSNEILEGKYFGNSTKQGGRRTGNATDFIDITNLSLQALNGTGKAAADSGGSGHGAGQLATSNEQRTGGYSSL